METDSVRYNQFVVPRELGPQRGGPQHWSVSSVVSRMLLLPLPSGDRLTGGDIPAKVSSVLLKFSLGLGGP